MASADNEGFLPSARLFPTGRICFLPLLRKDSASGKPGVLVEGCVSGKQHQHHNRATQTPSAASVDQPTAPTGTVRLKGKRLVKGVRLRDDAEQLQEYLSLLLKAPEPTLPLGGNEGSRPYQGDSLWWHLACLGAR